MYECTFYYAPQGNSFFPQKEINLVEWHLHDYQYILLIFLVHDVEKFETNLFSTTIPTICIFPGL